MGSADVAAFSAKLRGVGAAASFVAIEGRTRSAIKVMDEQRSKDTEFNQTGFTVSKANLEALFTLLEEALPAASWLVLSGSLPEGAPPDVYADLIALARRHHIRTCLDASGQPLLAGLAALPSLLRVNRTELEEAAGCPLHDHASLLSAIQAILQRGVERLAVSLGGQGVIAADASASVLVLVPPVKVVSLTGAGDTLTAGCLHAFSLGQPFQEALRFASALATVSTLREEPGDFSLDDLTTMMEKTTLVNL